MTIRGEKIGKAVADKVSTAVYEPFFRTPISTQFNNR